MFTHIDGDKFAMSRPEPKVWYETLLFTDIAWSLSFVVIAALIVVGLCSPWINAISPTFWRAVFVWLVSIVAGIIVSLVFGKTPLVTSFFLVRWPRGYNNYTALGSTILIIACILFLIPILVFGALRENYLATSFSGLGIGIAIGFFIWIVLDDIEQDIHRDG